MNAFLKKKNFSPLMSGFSVCGAGAGLALAFLTEVVCGNFYIYKFLLLPRHSPPIVLFFLLYTFFCALCGYLIGCLISAVGESREAILPLLCGICALLFLSLWYISFFKTCSFLFALFLLLFSLVMLFLTVKDHLFCFPILFLPVVLTVIGYIWFLWFNISVVLLN